jgi:subtilisin family serine protease
MVQFRMPPGVSEESVMRQLQQQGAGSPQPNVVFQLMQAPAAAAAPTVATARRGDPAQYMMGKLHLSDVHRVASGSNVTIAVIDSEVDREHSELAGTVAERFDATETEARPHSHGTAMAGAIASRDRLLGVAPGARILAVRAFSETQSSAESTTFTILKGLEWAVNQGARVINMSFAGPYDPTLERALRDAAAKGVVLIAATGNAGPKSPPLWPGADPNVIAVTAIDSGDKLFRQANRGPYVSVASPGVEILAPAPQAGYQMSTGTSIATAHVSGVVALMLERDPTLTPRDVRLILEATAKDLGPRGRDTQYGWGLVDPAKALAMVDERKRQKTSGASAPR